MAYFALDSLKNTIKRLLNSSCISVAPTGEEMLKSARECVRSVRKFLQELDSIRKRIESENIEALEGQITEAARKLEDVIESHVLNQFLSQSESLAGDEQQRLFISLDLQELRQDIDCFTQKVKKMDKLFEPSPEEDEVFSLVTDRAGNDAEAVGSFDQYRKFRDQLINMYATRAASIFGMKEKYIKELEILLPEQVDDDVAVSSRTDFAGSDSDMDGIPFQYRKILLTLINWWISKAASIFGMEEEDEYVNELDNPSMPEGKDDHDGAASSRTGFGGNKSKMVGLSDQFHEIRDGLLSLERRKLGVLAINGMPGIGKSTLAEKIIEDPLILRNFECRAFVSLGQKYQLKEILQAIVAQVNPDNDKKLMEGGEKELDEHLRETLNGTRYFIVLDDVWQLDFWDDWRRILPDEDNGSRILVTTRLGELARSIGRYGIYYMPFLDKEESWDLFRGTAFAEEGCRPQLEKAGKRIAENCEGLPLLIVTVAHLLSKAEMTREYWNNVAASKENSIFMDAYDQISKVLYPSYNYLRQDVKIFFLFVAAFPQNYEVSVSKLINLWNAEGSLDVLYKDVQSAVEVCLENLVSSNLVLVCKRSRFSNKLKTCSLHSVFWHLCKREARNNKFLHIFNSCSDAFAKGIKSMRCLSIYKNILFGIKDAYNSMASISTARLLLCTGQHHQYQVPMCFGLRLLRVLDALSIRFYEFPGEVLKLIHLRYLALTCNGNLPPSISKLWNLKCLIVHQYLSIKSIVAESYLPVEIWDLQELNYLEIMGRSLPDPPCDVVLPNLLTLLNVGARSCTKSVLESIPKLNKLRVQLTCVVVNPNLRSEIVASPYPLSVVTSSLRKLSLNGFGYPWKDMKKIADLPFLEVLKLQRYAFRGEMWEAEEHRFPSLEYLLIEETDLVHWTTGYETFPTLFCLTINNCYKLQKIPTISSVQEIQLVDCNPLAMIHAKQMEDGDHYCHVYADSSFFVG